MATLVQIAGLTGPEVEEIDRYGNAVVEASERLEDAIREILGFSSSPKVPRPNFNERQEKVLIFHMGVLAARRMGK